MKMNKDEGIGPFFTKIAQVRDQLTAIGIVVDDDDLVQTVADGLPNSCETFLASVNGRENQPNFERLWHDCLEEEGRTSGKVTKEGNLALAAKTKKFKKPSPQQKKGKKPQSKYSDVSEVECYNCHRFGTMPGITGSRRRKSKVDFKLLLQKKKKKNLRRRRTPGLTKKTNLEESTT